MMKIVCSRSVNIVTIAQNIVELVAYADSCGVASLVKI